jgi:apolipoprotein N-acyltransferase
LFGVSCIITFIIFYLICGFWILKITGISYLIGLIAIIPISIILSFYPYFLRSKKKHFYYLYFIVAWITGEYIQTFFSICTPFYNLGNFLGIHPILIQWYEFTGSFGGTLWILSINILIYELVLSIIGRREAIIRKLVFLLIIIFLPIIISLLIFSTYIEKGEKHEVLIIHPNTDCFLEKYKMNVNELIDHYLEIINTQITDNTSYAILPETALTNCGWVHQLNGNLIFDRFYQKMEKHKSLKLVSGAITFEEGNIQSDKSSNLRFSKKNNCWYRTYNSAIMLENGHPVQIRTKQELVPFQEYAPFSQFLPKIKPVGIEFNFSSRKVNQDIFISSKNERVSTIICYEIAYGKLFSKYARMDAEAFFVILNEGWYNNLQVSRQFVCLASIRAIENRRDIAYSSNMGISCYINQKGNILQSLSEKQADCIRTNIFFNKKKTVYCYFGDYIGFLSLVILLIMFLCLVISEQCNKTHLNL